MTLETDAVGSQSLVTKASARSAGTKSWSRTANWVEYFGFSYHQIRASGHAPLDKVGYLVNRIGGKTVIPVHTERPDLFSSFAESSRVLQPKKGTKIQLA